MDAPAPWFMLPIAIQIGKKPAGLEYQCLVILNNSRLAEGKLLGRNSYKLGFLGSKMVRFKNIDVIVRSTTLLFYHALAATIRPNTRQAQKTFLFKTNQ